ncbi:restriction endonuclease subunit S [Pantoea sp. Marseille-Q5743]|uniref:restriction endonuclease subunit S n=1 Tax=Pantoea sp. Marseille-Q5743 TaxID=2972776 RepID=UPI0021C8F7D0|nr:restriction endonuclease subunit S [Pantoea sp. Marseille-Q5743]
MSAEQLITQHINTWTSALQTRSTAGRGNNGKIDLYGIKKLRELILELAVRGKLVPQDPDDEPASELLKRIAAEKDELVKQGKIKKQKPLTKITEDEKPFELPVGWEWTKLSDAYDVRDGTHDTPKYQSSGYPLVTSKNLSSGKLDLNNIKYISEKDHIKINERSFVERNDILFAMIGSIGNPVIVDIDEEFSIKNIALFKSYKKEFFQPLFIKYVLDNLAKKIKESSSGGVQPFVSLGTLRNLVIAFPPLSEQIRIVSKLTDLMSLCDQLEQQSLTSLEAHSQLVNTLLATLTNSQNAEELAENWVRISQHFDTLFTTEASIDAFKQTILQLAVMGKLVPQDPNDEPASELLKRIEQEKAQLVKEGKIKKQKTLPPVSDDDIPFELPKGWMWARVGDILSLKNGYAFKSNFFVEFRSKYILTTPGNFYETGGFRHRGDKTKYYHGPLDEEFILNPGDLIIPMTEQAPGLLGSAAFIPKDEYIYLHNQRLGKIEMYHEGVISEFIFWFFNSQLLRTELARTCTGTTVRHTSPDRILNALVPVVPSNEQYRITEKINNLMLLCDVLKSRLQSAQQTQLHLADALTDTALS